MGFVVSCSEVPFPTVKLDVEKNVEGACRKGVDLIGDMFVDFCAQNSETDQIEYLNCRIRTPNCEVSRH